MAKLSAAQRKFSVRSIRLMMKGRKYSDGPQRMRNFIRINYGVEYTSGHCRRIWKREGLKRA